LVDVSATFSEQAAHHMLLPRAAATDKGK
jgi:hypothetical protein